MTKHGSLKPLRSAQPGEEGVGKIAEQVVEVWQTAIAAIPEWQEVIDKKVRPSELRGKGFSGYVFAFGVGWQAIALAAAALISHRPKTWRADLERAIRAVDWAKGRHWNSIAMVGDRVNNTGPGIRATAGYILKEGGFAAGDGVYIKDLLETLEKSLEAGAPSDDGELDDAA